jgi:hypothetical protein
LRLLGKEVPDGGGGMAHGDCFVQGKALAPILGGQDVIARTLTDEDNKATIFSLIEKMLTNKKFKDFFARNVAGL